MSATMPIEPLERRVLLAAAPYLESAGQVVIEAEHYDVNIARGGRSWTATKTVAEFAGDGAMIAGPDSGANLNSGFTASSPELRYSVKFSTAGVYRVWLRAHMPDGDANSAHVGLDGVAVGTADRMSGPITNASAPWRWFDNTMDGPLATINITTAGVHTINLWMREDGFVLDRILLARSTSVFPIGIGPAESPRQAAPIANTLPSLDPELDSPWNVHRLTASGERAAWSPDGKKIAYISKMFGDACEIDLATGKTRLLTGFFAHHGFIRVDYLPDGNFLLTGARKFTTEQYTRYHDEELWVLAKDLSKPPTALNQKVNEGVAIARGSGNHIAWTNNSAQYPLSFPSGGNAMYTGDIVYTNGVATLVNKKQVYFDADYIDVQDFRDANRELIFSRYLLGRASVLGVRLDTHAVKIYRSSNIEYNEAEGIFPDGSADVVESSRDKGLDKQGPQYIDLWQLSLVGGALFKRLTRWGDFAGYKSSNPDVSPDGRYIAFQSARTGETAGVGHGIFILDLRSIPANPHTLYSDTFSATGGTVALTAAAPSLTRTISTAGYKDISLNLTAFQSGATFEAADKLKIEIDTGAGFERLLTDGQRFQAIDNASGDDDAASVSGATSPTSTGWLALQSSASNNKSVRIRITGTVSAADEKYFLDALQLIGTTI
jgi:hypothetical protein